MITVTYYFMDGCGFCEMFNKEWEKICDDKELSKHFTFQKKGQYDIPSDTRGKIEGFPTVMLGDGDEQIGVVGFMSSDDAKKEYMRYLPQLEKKNKKKKMSRTTTTQRAGKRRSKKLRRKTKRRYKNKRK